MKTANEITLQELLDHPENIIRIQAEAIWQDLKMLGEDEFYPRMFTGKFKRINSDCREGG